MTKLNATRVRELCMSLLPNEQVEGKTDEQIEAMFETGELIKVPGIMSTFAFVPDKIAETKPEIQSMAECLPDDFFLDSGGGWSFLQMCVDREGVHWAEHPTMEMLCVLMIGAGIAQWIGDKKLWQIMPGGMPYIQIDRSKFTEVSCDECGAHGPDVHVQECGDVIEAVDGTYTCPDMLCESCRS